MPSGNYCSSWSLTGNQFREKEKLFLDCNYIELPWKMFTHKSYFQPNSIINDNIMTHSSKYDSTSGSFGWKYIIKPKFVISFDVHSCELINKEVKTFQKVDRFNEAYQRSINIRNKKRVYKKNHLITVMRKNRVRFFPDCIVRVILTT